MRYPFVNQRLPTKFDNERVACGWAFVLIGYICLIIGLSVLAFINLPKDLYFNENPEEFIGARAKYDLSSLTSAGPRPVGSYANEVVMVNYLTRKIESIFSESISWYYFEVDVQVASGSYKRYGTLNFYESIQNVIVKLKPRNTNHTNALLINSHFDSVVSSPGAGDAGSMVAVMLGVITSLTKSLETVKHPLIFLFNGDEENGLEASHAFITQHKWAKDVKIFINLDAMGIGGKEILFQSDPRSSWLLNYYSKAAKHPFASVLGEEIFESNILPSDTDFRIFRDYGKLPGLDFAYISNGYAYHTVLDKFYNVEGGTLQHTGDNILALVKALANADELDESYKFESTGKAVYFDVLGVFFVKYSENVGIVLNCVISILALVAIGVSIWLMSDSTDTSLFYVVVQFLFTFLILLIALVVAAVSVISLSFFMDWIDYTMSWFSEPGLIFGLYFCPFLFIAGMIITLFLHSQSYKRLPLKFRVTLFLHAQCVIYVVLIFTLMAMNYRSIFFITHVVLFYLLATMMNFLPVLHSSSYLWLFPIVLLQTFPLVFNSYILQILYTVLIPVSGRIQDNPELNIAFCAIIFSVLLFGFILPIFGIFRYAKSILTILLVVFVVDLGLALTGIGFPYTSDTPQRHIIYHTARTKHGPSGIVKQDTIFATYLYDRRAEQTIDDIARLRNLEYFTWETDTITPLYYGGNYRLFPTELLDIPEKSNVTLLSKEQLPESSKTYRFTFRIDGAAKKYRILIDPRSNLEMIDWSFKTSPEEEIEFRPPYTVNLQFGKSSPPYDFWVTFKVANPSSVALTLALHAEYSLEPYQFTWPFGAFLRNFPKWTVPIGIVASYDIYDFEYKLNPTSIGHGNHVILN